MGRPKSARCLQPVAGQNIRPSGWTTNTHFDISADQIGSRREQWTSETLGKLVRGHNSTAGQDFGCPIIIAEYGGVQRVLDGNHRINRWVGAGDSRVHDVNIHTVSETGAFIELPAVAGAPNYRMHPTAFGRG
jgi:hypothetical protein